MNLMSRGFRGISSRKGRAAVFHGPPDNGSAPLSIGLGLKVHDGLLPQEDQKLPFTRHVFGTLQEFHFVQHLIVIEFMRAKEVVIGDPEGQVIVGAVDVVETVGRPVRGLVSAVPPVQSSV